MAKKAFVEGLSPVFFPGYYLLAFGVQTPYLGFISAAMMVVLRLRLIAFEMFSEQIESLLRQNAIVPLGLCGVVVCLDMLFSTSLVVHLCLILPLLAFLKQVNQQQMKEFDNKYSEWSKWMEIPLEILSCFIAALFYSIFPLTRGMSLNGLGCAAAFALFIPQVREQVSSALAQIVKSAKTIPPLKTNSPPPLPPKPSKFE
jgi:hypothetical protein